MILVCVNNKIGYNHSMKTPRTYRIIALLIAALVFSPILSISTAQAIMQDEASQAQTLKSSSTECHQKTDKSNCKHCSDATHSGGQCDNSCEHGISSVAMTAHVFDTAFFQQDKQATIKQLNHSIDPDTQLRPPKFA